jgi:hypothetical protein
MGCGISPKVSAKVQFASIHFAVVMTSSLLEHWHVVLARLQLTEGTVSARYISYIRDVSKSL